MSTLMLVKNEIYPLISLTIEWRGEPACGFAKAG
jgi:hypothetical protein